MMKTAPHTQAPVNLLLRNPMQTGMEPVRRVKHSETLTSKEEEAVLRFYKMLAPEANNIIIDIDMIVSKAYPVFERELGSVNWKKIQQYFGLCGKTVSKKIRSEEVSLLVAKLRTIENAQYYLYGFSELISKYAAKLSRAPEGMNELEKAKVVRMFEVFFGSHLFFAEDYVFPVGSPSPKISFPSAMKVNKINIYPEQMFYLYDSLIKKYSDGSFLYDAIVQEINAFDKKIRKEILDIAELQFADSKVLVSVNSRTVGNYTFGYVRSIKSKMFPCCGYFPNELYVVTDLWDGIEFGELYNVYKKLTKNEFSSFASCRRNVPHVEGNRFFEKEMEYKSIAPSILMSCESEAKRFVRFIEYLAKNNFSMPIELTNEDRDEIFTAQVEIGKFFAFLKFAHSMKYIDEKSSSSDEYSMYLTLLEYDAEGELFGAYMREEISDEELKDKLGISLEFEEKVLGIEHVETPMQTVRRFALENGLVTEEDFSEDLAENVLIAGNENLWERFSQKKITANKLMEKLGLDKDIIEMYFDISKIDIQVIEQMLQELKAKRVSAKEMKKYALTINLYCYIIEGQIACGPKNKIPKGNKRLKPENLKKLLAAS